MEKILGHIGIPRNSDKVFHSYMRISGWAFSTNGDEVKIQLYLDNKLKNEFKTSLRNSAVLIKYANLNPYPNCGFSGILNLNDEHNGDHSLKIMAKSNGYEKVLKTFEFNLDKQFPTSSTTYDKKYVNMAGNSWDRSAREFMRYFLEYCNLKPNYKVLDVGCGFGKMALYLSTFLSYNGRYNGFDVSNDAISWCKQEISENFHNFEFNLVNLYNEQYNPDGNLKSSEIVFPYKDESFDLVFLLSVFTHMFPLDVKRYLSEIWRVMKKDGKCLITFFILNNNTLELIEKKSPSFTFKYQFDGFKSQYKEVPETAVAYDESWIRKIYDDSGLKIIEPILFGKWPDRVDGISGQDIVLGTKKL